ncbi:MAG: hypothetical protein E7412_05735 [Ruminococcaceae bacterium]|nr:hypothetical protein [Oscillospiraceae bacterium]
MAAPFKDYVDQAINSHLVGGPKIYEKLIHDIGVEEGIAYEKNLLLKTTCPLLCVGVGMMAIGTYAFCEATYKYIKEKYEKIKAENEKN